MNSAEDIIKAIEQDLQISLNDRPNALRYETEDGIVTELKVQEKHFENFDALSQLYNTVKKLEIWWDCTFNEDVLAENLKKFTALEELAVSTTTIKATNEILALRNLQKLSIWAKLDTKTQTEDTCLLNVSALNHIQELLISCIINPENDHYSCVIEGAEQLQNLRELTIECNCPLTIAGLNELPQLKKLKLYDVDIQSIPQIENLQTLSASHAYLDEFHCAGKFPNLENLEIDGFSSISIGRLDKLKILVMGARDFDLEQATCFDHIPNLEQLSLTWCDITAVKKIGKLKNLKLLDLSENQELANIEELGTLKSLEKLNLYDNKVTDIRVLNQLPNLKQVDLAGNPIGPKEVEEQLENPSIACFMGRPHVPFIVGGWKTF